LGVGLAGFGIAPRDIFVAAAPAACVEQDSR
jgi:hypothetical protein